MNIWQKAIKVSNALHQLADEIAQDAVIDAPSAVLAVNAIDRFISDASADSKARLYDLLTENFA